MYPTNLFSSFLTAAHTHFRWGSVGILRSPTLYFSHPPRLSVSLSHLSLVKLLDDHSSKLPMVMSSNWAHITLHPNTEQRTPKQLTPDTPQASKNTQPPEALLSANKTLNGEHLIEHTMHSCSRQARKEAASNKKQKINQEQRIEKQIFSNRKKSMARCANVRRRRKRKWARFWFSFWEA